MLFTPARRLAAVATAAAVLAGTVIPAVVAEAEELPQTVHAPIAEVAEADTTAAPTLAVEPGEAVEASAASSTAIEETSALAGGASDEPQQTEPEPGSPEQASAAPAAHSEIASPRTAAATPSPSGSVLLTAGETWSGIFPVEDAESLRFVALGTKLRATVTDAAGLSTWADAANGYLDVYLGTDTPDGDVTVTLRNTGSAVQTVRYGFGWVGHEYRANGSSGIGQPSLLVTAAPRKNGASIAATATASYLGVDGSTGSSAMPSPSYYAMFTGLAPGRYVVIVEMVIEGARVVNAWTTTVAAAETTPPVVDVTTVPATPTNSWFAGPVKVTMVATDEGSGPASILWGLDTAELTEYRIDRWTVPVTTEGTHQLRYQGKDYQGNISALATRQINIDATPPTVAFEGFGDASFPYGAEIVAEYTCADALSGVQSCVGDVASGELIDTTTPGTHFFRVTATDKAGNTTSTESSYTVLEPDTTDPVLEVEIPAEPESGWYRDSVTVRFTASDESGIRRIHYEYDTVDETVVRDIEADTAEITFDRTWLHTLSFWAEDNAGNRSEGDNIDVRVDADAPWIEVYSPDEDLLSILPNGHVAQNERIVIDFACDDEGSGIATCEGSTPDGELLPTGTPGTHELRLVATDRVGHRTERVVTYTVDADPAQGGSNGGVVRPQGGLASTGAQDVVSGLALAVLLLGAGAALVIRRRVRTR